MRAIRAAVVLVVAAIATTACQHGGHPEAVPASSSSSVAGRDNGVSSLPAKEIAIRAGQAIHNVPVHMHGTIPDRSLGVTTLDLISNGSDEGRCTNEGAGETIDMVRVGGKEYVRASASLWMRLGLPALSSSAAATRADGKYVRAPIGRLELVRLTHFLDAGQVLAAELPGTETATKGGTAIISGVPTVAITAVTPGTSPDPIGTVYVATVGEPYVMQWDSPHDAGRFVYSYYMKPFVIEAPPADQVIDLDDLLT
jgi:hypothetical protein